MRKFLLTVAILGVLAVLSTAAAILDEEVQTAAGLGAEPMITAPADLLCQADLEPEPLFPSFLDGLRQGACSCIDQCRFDFQCGPGGSCVPVGPCGCKECAASS